MQGGLERHASVVSDSDVEIKCMDGWGSVWGGGGDDGGR